MKPDREDKGDAGEEAEVSLVGLNPYQSHQGVAQVDWGKKDVQILDSWTEQNVRKFLGLPKDAVVYRSMIPISDLNEQLVEEQDGDPSGYDWSELSLGRSHPPPILVTRKADDTLVVNDGNHRIRFWRESGHEYAPAWVYDELITMYNRENHIKEYRIVQEAQADQDDVIGEAIAHARLESEFISAIRARVKSQWMINLHEATWAPCLQKMVDLTLKRLSGLYGGEATLDDHADLLKAISGRAGEHGDCAIADAVVIGYATGNCDTAIEAYFSWPGEKRKIVAAALSDAPRDSMEGKYGGLPELYDKVRQSLPRGFLNAGRELHNVFSGKKPASELKSQPPLESWWPSPEKTSGWYGRGRIASIRLNGDVDDEMLRQALSRKDIVMTLLGLTTFMGIPWEARMAIELKDWIEGKGGSTATATELARAVGKQSPEQLTREDVQRLVSAVGQEEIIEAPDRPEQKAPEASVNQNEKIILAKTLFHEAGIEGYSGIEAVASAIYNRAGGNPKKMVRVVKAPKQFSCWNTGHLANGKGPSWDASLNLAEKLLNGTFKPSHSFTHYYNPKLANPGWAYVGGRLRPHKDIGRHRFTNA